VRAAAVGVLLAACGPPARGPAPPPIANTAPTPVAPLGWVWDPLGPANAAEEPTHHFGSGGCVFTERRVVCEPGAPSADFVKWTVSFGGEIVAYTEADSSFYLVVLADPPMVVAVSTATKMFSWQVPVRELSREPAEVERRRIQVHVEDRAVTVSTDERTRQAWHFAVDTGRAL
jgi:hypothetical protein